MGDDTAQLVTSVWPRFEAAARTGRLLPLVSELRNELGSSHPLHRLVRADLEARLGIGEMEAVQELSAHPEIAGQPDLTAWCSAVLAETGLWQGQLWGYLVGAAALSSIPASSSRPIRYARARVERIAALVELVTQSMTDEPIEPLIDRAVEPFRELGLDEEVATTEALLVGFHVMGLTGEQRQHFLDRFRRTIEPVTFTSDRGRLGQVALGWIAIANNDRTEAERALAKARAAPDPLAELTDGPDDRAFGPMERLVAAVVDLQQHGATDLHRERLLSYLETYNGFLIPTTYAALVIAQILLDRGAPDAALEALGRVDQTELSFNPFSYRFFALLERLASIAVNQVVHADADGATSTTHDAAEVIATCQSLFGTHQEPLARHLLLTLSWITEDADLRSEVRTMALSGLDATSDLAIWLGQQDDILQSGWENPQPRTVVRTGELHCLGPRIELITDGRQPHRLTSRTAHLVALLIAHKGRLDVDAVAHEICHNLDDPKAALRSVLYRARRELADFDGIDIRRDGAELRLDVSDAWVIDAWQLEQRLRQETVDATSETSVPLFCTQIESETLDNYRHELLRRWARTRPARIDTVEAALAAAEQTSPYWAGEARWQWTLARQRAGQQDQ